MTPRDGEGRRGADDSGGLDDLFGDDAFREYDDTANPFVAPRDPAPRRPRTEPGRGDAAHPEPPLDTTPPATPPPPVVPPPVVPTAAPPRATTPPPADPPPVSTAAYSGLSGFDLPLLAEEPRGPVHDRFSETVAMPMPDEARTTAYPIGDAAAPGLPPRTVSGAAAGAMPTVAMHAADPTEAFAQPPFVPHTSPPAPERRRRAAMGTPQRVLFGIAAAAALGLLLFALYLLGTKIGGDGADTATSGEDGAAASGSLEPGVHPWTALQGGECLDSFDTAWAEEFTVADCADAHDAQHMFAGEVGPEVTVYLDAEGWQGLITTLCDAGTLLDLNAAAAYGDLQWHITYAGDATAWENGDRGYSCFIDRSSGDPITGSLLASAG